MFDFFDTIVEYLSICWNWLTGFFSASADFFTAVTEAVTVPTMLVGWMPDLIGACIGSVVAVAVVKAIFGR